MQVKVLPVEIILTEELIRKHHSSDYHAVDVFEIIESEVKLCTYKKQIGVNSIQPARHSNCNRAVRGSPAWREERPGTRVRTTLWRYYTCEWHLYLPRIIEICQTIALYYGNYVMSVLVAKQIQICYIYIGM